MGYPAQKAQPSAWLTAAKAVAQLAREDQPPRSHAREDVPGYAALPAAPSDGRRNDEPRPGPWRGRGAAPRWARRFQATLRAGFDLAKRHGFSRTGVAKSLGVSDRTIESWLMAGSSTVIPGDQLYRLVVEDRHLPLTARQMVLSSMAADAGMLLVRADGATLETAPLAVQVCEVMAASGKVGAAARDAVDRGSDGGPALTAIEAEGLLAEVLEAQRELGQLAESLRQRVHEAPPPRGAPRGRGLVELGQGEYARRIDVTG